MKTIKFLLVILSFGQSYTLLAQKSIITPDLSEIKNKEKWSVSNRNVTWDKAVYLDKKNGDGLVRLNKLIFANGKIDLDIKGKNEPGGSFVGIAFHGLNDSIFDAVYFRPFNFKNTDRGSHSVQYVSQPKYTWNRLREEFPGKYESMVDPVPNPDEWFHATIVIEYPVVKVFVNYSETPSLTVNQLSSRKEGWIGFWVGNTSDGYFRNLQVTPY